jgi:uncharacterized protein (TIGR02452 family)
MTRDQCAAIAAETIEILRRGHYTAPSGAVVSIEANLAASKAGTRLIRPEEWGEIVAQAQELPREGAGEMAVTAETTLEAARRLVSERSRDKVLALNFASARNPGGGFLNGARAQEESIARSSGLYPSLLKCQAYYDANRAYRGTLYTDHAIICPAVPVIRDDTGTLLEKPYELSILTMPAPNRGAMRADSWEIPEIAGTFRRRIERIFALAAVLRQDTLIFGAWGCGAFRNDPAEVAGIFAEVLAEGWARCFGHVCFAIFDSSRDGRIRAAFETRFAGQV